MPLFLSDLKSVTNYIVITTIYFSFHLLFLKVVTRFLSKISAYLKFLNLISVVINNIKIEREIRQL